MAAKPKIRPYRPIEKQPRTALFQRHPNVTEALGEYQEALRTVAGDPEALKQLQWLREQENRAFAVANTEMERHFTLTPEARAQYIDRGIEDPEAIQFSFIGKEFDPKGEARSAHRKIALGVLQDQAEGIAITRQDEAECRPLTQQWIKDMHGLLTRHQPHARSVAKVEGLGAQDGTIPMVSGQYKKTDNDVALPDGSIQQYCPMGPMVIEEMERLLQMHEENFAQGTAPETEAAWMMRQLKHIHPFQDGNSRTSRMLMCFVLLRHMLPIIIFSPVEHREPLESAMFQASQERNWTPLIEFIRGRVIEKLKSDTRQIQRAARGEPIITPLGNGIHRNGELHGLRLN